jgi:hypothetical protein
VLFVDVVRDTRHRAHLGVAQFAALERSRDEWPLAQAVGDPHVVAGRAGRDPTRPAQPVGAVLEAPVPAAALVEFGDQREPARGRCSDVCRKFSDLVAEAV